MRVVAKILALSVLASAIGCAGGGPDRPNPTADNQFAGNYTGTFNGGSGTGTSNFQVASDGGVVGSLNDGAGNVTEITGTLSGTGVFGGQARLNGSLNTTSVTGNFNGGGSTLDGQISIGGQGTSTLTMTRNNNF